MHFVSRLTLKRQPLGGLPLLIQKLLFSVDKGQGIVPNVKG